MTWKGSSFGFGVRYGHAAPTRSFLEEWHSLKSEEIHLSGLRWSWRGGKVQRDAGWDGDLSGKEVRHTLAANTSQNWGVVNRKDMPTAWWETWMPRDTLHSCEMTPRLCVLSIKAKYTCWISTRQCRQKHIVMLSDVQRQAWIYELWADHVWKIEKGHFDKKWMSSQAVPPTHYLPSSLPLSCCVSASKPWGSAMFDEAAAKHLARISFLSIKMSLDISSEWGVAERRISFLGVLGLGSGRASLFPVVRLSVVTRSVIDFSENHPKSLQTT